MNSAYDGFEVYTDYGLAECGAALRIMNNLIDAGVLGIVLLQYFCVVLYCV